MMEYYFSKSIKEIIEDFLQIVLEEKADSNNLEELNLALDRLSYSINLVKYKFDERDYPDPPERNYSEIRAVVENRFPSLGYYNIAAEIVEKIGESEVNVGDAVDDLTDIVCDLNEVIWCYENTSTDDALWNYQNSYKTHWGRHLKTLQLYLYENLN
ncbi:MAG: DUF5063 domain-containing protein [Leptospirales bacterium]